MHFIIQLLINAAVLLIAAYIMPSVEIKSFGKALLVALLIGVLNATVGFLIRLPLNLVTLGLLSFFVRLFVTAIIIKIVDALMTSFNVKGFLTAIILAVILALTSTAAEYLLWK